MKSGDDHKNKKSLKQPMLKRTFDLFFASISVLLLLPLFSFAWLLACMDTQTNGIFIQKRIGRYGKPFLIYKLRTIQPKRAEISNIGSFLRKLKLDELPQLINVLQGTMSMVGPRPDIAGYYDVLEGEERLILNLKPGLTSEAAIKYVNEETLLKQQKNALHYNDTVLFPDKVQLNLAYYYNHTFFGDLKIIWKTFLVVFKS